MGACMQFKDGTAYFVRAVIYARKMFFKSTTGVNVIRLCFFFIDAPDK
jgi:hypothetical protein